MTLKYQRLEKAIAQHPGLFPLLGMVLRGPFGKWIWLVSVFITLFTVLFFICIYRMWVATEVLVAVKYGTLAILFGLVVAMQKLWIWLEMQKTSLFLMQDQIKGE